MKKVASICLATAILSFTFFSFRSEKELPTIENKNSSPLPTLKNEAFKRGEKLTFRMHYGFIDAGIASLSVTNEEKEFGGRKTYHVVGLGQSKGAFDWFYKVRDRYETYIDDKAIVPWLFIRRISEGGFTASQDYIFNHYEQKVNVGNNKEYDIEPNMQDMVSAFYRARTLDLSKAKPGDIYTINCFVDNEIFPVKIKFIKRDVVKTELGKIRCLQFRPVVQKGRIFKDEEDLNVWISDDKNHIPVKGQADVLVGSIKVELTSFSGLANPVAIVE